MSDAANRVRRQYEEAPYPRWTSPVGPSEELREAVACPPKRVLVAGCGTGRDAIAVALTFPAAEVLAIDVSAPSVRKAREHAAEYGVTINFAVADLFDIPAVPRYDLVVAVGVIHHLDDPERGLATLRDALAPDGRVVVGLYSRLGRWPLGEVRKIAVEHGYQRTLAGAAQFLNDSSGLIPLPLLGLVRRYPDFHYPEGVRDLLFHEHEIEFGLNEVRDMLARLGLACARVMLRPHVIDDFQRSFPGTKLTDLTAWRQYEMRHPGTFRAMYRLVLAHNGAR